MSAHPVCPKCGGVPALLNERPASSGALFLLKENADEDYVIRTYRCVCGTVLAQTEKQKDREERDNRG